MSTITATAVASANIAFIKYWGNINHELRLPQNGSISMNLSGLQTKTTLTYQPNLIEDRLYLNGKEQRGESLSRVSKFLNHCRRLGNKPFFVCVESENNFPIAAGIASSASAFAALSTAANVVFSLDFDETALSRLARLGSGSACRSIPSGFVEWKTGETDEESYAFSIAPPHHWQLIDVIAVVDEQQKKVGSSEGHQLAETSPLQLARVSDTPKRLALCRQAILNKDFELFAYIVEHDCHLMHAVMMTSKPPLIYWSPQTLQIINEVLYWRKKGLAVCYTIDAGANVHLLCEEDTVEKVSQLLSEIKGVKKLFTAYPAEGAKCIESILKN